MDTLNVFKNYIEQKLMDAKTSLILVDAVRPLFVTMDKSGVFKDTPLTMNPAKAEDAWMKEICQNPDIVMASLIFDGYRYERDKEAVEKLLKEKPDVDLMDLPSAEVIHLFLYTREKVFYRFVQYQKQEGQEGYYFADSGWTENLPFDSSSENVFRAS